MPEGTLPVLLSIPHAGLQIPPEIAAQLAIDATTIYNECDLFADQLFDFAHPELATEVEPEWGLGVLGTVTTPVARVLVDVNRRPDSLEDPDGAIKLATSYGDPVYQSTPALAGREQLLATYWQPFHARLRALVRQHSHRCRLILDCHNMAQVGPAAYGDAGTPRPFVCLANLGNERGEPRPGEAVTCAPDLLQASARIAEELFADLALLEPQAQLPPAVGINRPFPGGYILRMLQEERHVLGLAPDVPIIMVEINRGLFVGLQDSKTAMKPARDAEIAAIRSRLYHWLVRTLALL